MPIKVYTEYVHDLMAIVKEAVEFPNNFQKLTLSVMFMTTPPLVVQGFADRSNAGTSKNFEVYNMSISQPIREVDESVFVDLIDAFNSKHSYVALSGRQPTAGSTIRSIVEEAGECEDCFVNIAYRKKGQPKMRSQRMHFYGFMSNADALSHALTISDPMVLIQDWETRNNPIELHEWI